MLHNLLLRRIPPSLAKAPLTFPNSIIHCRRIYLHVILAPPLPVTLHQPVEYHRAYSEEIGIHRRHFCLQMQMGRFSVRQEGQR